MNCPTRNCLIGFDLSLLSLLCRFPGCRFREYIVRRHDRRQSYYHSNSYRQQKNVEENFHLNFHRVCREVWVAAECSVTLLRSAALR